MFGLTLLNHKPVVLNGNVKIRRDSLIGIYNMSTEGTVYSFEKLNSILVIKYY